MLDVIEQALSSYLRSQGKDPGESERLRYSSDLDPEACERQIRYRILKTKREETTLGDELRFWGGRIFERVILDSLHKAGEEPRSQVQVRPLRPSAWAWATGHADILLPKRKVLLEVKAPRGNAFEFAGSDPRKLVKVGHRWQFSAYFHELRALGLVEGAMWVFVDREGSHRPVGVPLSSDLLIPLPEIVAQEERRARLVLPDTPLPPRLPREVTVSVLKGRGSSGRTLDGSTKTSWRCSYCPFSAECRPGPSTGFYELSAEEKARVLAEAEKRWAAGEQRVSVSLGFAPNDDGEAPAQAPAPPAPPATAPVQAKPAPAAPAKLAERLPVLDPAQAERLIDGAGVPW